MPSAPYGGGPYKELKTQYKAGDGTMPTLWSTEVSVDHMDQHLMGEPLAGAYFVSRTAREKGGQIHLVCFKSPVM